MDTGLRFTKRLSARLVFGACVAACSAGSAEPTDAGGESASPDALGDSPGAPTDAGDAATDATLDGGGPEDADVDSADALAPGSDADAEAAAAPSACADAGSFVVSAEVPLPPLTYGPRTFLPGVAFDGANFLLVWQEGTPPSTSVLATRVTPAGVVVDEPPIVVGRGAAPVVGFDGTNYLVVWQSTTSGTFGARLSPQGVVLDPAGLSTPSRLSGYEVGCRPGQCLVVWRPVGPLAGTVYVSRIGPTGAALDLPPILIAPAPDAGFVGANAAPDSDGTDFVIPWMKWVAPSAASGRWSRVSGASGAVVASGGPLTSRPFAQDAPSIAFGGTGHLLVWEDFSSSIHQLVGVRLDLDGGVLDPSGVMLAPSSADQVGETVGFDGDAFMSAWTESFPGGTSLQVTRIRLDGRVDPSPMTIESVSGDAGFCDWFDPQLASDRHGTSLLAYMTCDGAPQRTMHARILVDPLSGACEPPVVDGSVPDVAPGPPPDASADAGCVGSPPLVCANCGHPGESCCTSATGGATTYCEGGRVCTNTGVCPNCGGPDQLACGYTGGPGSAYCAFGHPYDAMSGRCEYCDARGNACCAHYPPNGAYFCIGGLSCTGGQCQ